MDIAQTYETTITECDSKLAVQAIVIPRSSMAPYAQGDLVEWASLLGLQAVALLESDAEMVSVLASTLAAHNGDGRPVAERVVWQGPIPFVTEELAGLSLSAIARTADVPFHSVVSLVASRRSNLLLLAVPAGVVLCSSAQHLGAALGAGLAERINEVVGLDGDG